MIDVMLLTAEYPPLEGGVGDYTACLARSLATACADAGGSPSVAPARVAVLTGTAAGGSTACRAAACGRGATDRPDGAGAPPEANGRVGRPVEVLPLLSRWDWRGLALAARIVAERRPAILHIQYQTAAYHLHPAVNLLPLLVRAAAPAGRRPRIVTTFHDLRPPYLFPKAGPLRGLAAPLLAATSDAAVLTTPELLPTPAGRRLRRLAGHLTCIPIGSNIAPVAVEPAHREAVRRGAGAAPGTFLIGYFGLVNRTKGLDDLVRALPLLRRGGVDARLLIVGGTPGASDPTNRAARAAIRALEAELGVADHVAWTGWLDPAATSAALATLDALALPYRDGASFQRGSLLAGLAHGLPIVTTRPARRPTFPGWPALRDGESALLVPPGRPDRLAEALAGLAGDPELRARLRAGGRALGPFFAWERIAALTLALYRRLLGPAGGQA